MKKLSLDRKKRIKEFIAKAEKEHRLPESYFAHLELEIDLIAWEGFANIKAQLMSINPFCALAYIFGKRDFKIEPSREMRKHASNALANLAKLGDVKRAKGMLSDPMLAPDVNYLDRHGRSPLYYAIARKRLGMAELLLKNGADDRAAPGQETPLLRACRDGFIPGISLLMKHGFDTNKPVPYRSWNKWYMGYRRWHIYPLAWTLIQSEKPAKVCQMLLDNGADIDKEFAPKHTVRWYLDNRWNELAPDVQSVFAPVMNKTADTPLSVNVNALSVNITTNITINSVNIDTFAHPKTEVIDAPSKVATHQAVFPELPAPQNMRT